MEITTADFQRGSLPVTSYARPAKLFTANESLFVSEVGVLRPESLDKITAAVVSVVRSQP